MPSPVFALTTTELQKKIIPQNTTVTFAIGANGDLSDADAETILAIAEDQALMRLKARLRLLLKECDGEVLITNAKGGETALQCGLYPVTSGTLKLWRNYPRGVTWHNRSDYDALASGEFTLTASTGAVVLTTPLIRGERVWATYNHTAATRMVGLRDLVLSIAAAETSRRFSYFRTAEGFDRFERWESSAYQSLNNMQGVDIIDRLKLVEDTDDFFARVVTL